ncbi:putative reticulon-like protein B21 [Sesbania bispinosa]|nr:putative reticulon-like protein B21 [Sesbania bispinosa]
MTHHSTDCQVERERGKEDKLGMEVGKRRVGARGSVVAGSVWETRMKSDEVKGGIKVFNAEENPEEGGGNGGSRLRRSSIGAATVASTGKRKTWKSSESSSEGLDKSPIQVAKGKPVTETQKNSEEPCKELSISASEGIKKSPIHARKIGSFADKIERSPIQNRKVRSDTQKGATEVGRENGESGEGHERNSGQLRKSKSDSIKKNAFGSGESRNEDGGSEGGCEKIEIENGENEAADENCKDFEVCQEKEISVPESKIVSEPPENNKVVLNEPDKKMVFSEPENKKVVNEPEPKKIVNEPEPKKVVSAHMRFHHRNERKPVSVPLAVKQSPSIRRNSTIYQNFSQSNSSNNPSSGEKYVKEKSISTRLPSF